MMENGSLQYFTPNANVVGRVFLKSGYKVSNDSNGWAISVNGWIFFSGYHTREKRNKKEKSQSNLSIIYFSAGFTISPRLSFFIVKLLHVYLLNFFTLNKFNVYFTKLKMSSPIVGGYQGFPKSWKFGLQLWKPKSFTCTRYDGFLIFSQIFRKFKLQNYFKKKCNSSSVVACCQVLPSIANLASKYDWSNLCSYRDMTCFVISFLFKKNLDLEVRLYQGTSRNCELCF